MSDEFYNDKFRIASARLSYWDYSLPAFNFVTICTKERICNLSEIKNFQVYLSEIGNVVFKCWVEIYDHFSFAELDDYIIMPNHIHGIIVIKDNDFNKNCRDKACLVSTECKFGHPPPKSLSSIIGSFKSAVSNKCHKLRLDFQWQRNYYEHIIRDDDDYARIKEYIANNPINWQNDRNNPININTYEYKRKN